MKRYQKVLAIVAIALMFVLSACGSVAPTKSSTDNGATQSANAAATVNAQQAQDVGATNTTPAAPAATGPYKVGDTVGTADGFDITVNSVSTATNSGNEFETPPPGDQFLVIDVSTKNMTTQVQQVNPLDFTLIDSTGQHMTWTILSSLPNTHTYDLTALQPGATNRGVLTYEVSTGKHSYQLTFAIDQFSGNQTQWNIHS